MVFMVDPGSHVSGQTYEVVYWWQVGLKSRPDDRVAGFIPLTSIYVPAYLDWVSPALPLRKLENPPVSHNFLFLLYHQPNSFMIPKKFKRFFGGIRVGFDVAALSNEAGLGSPIAANYFTARRP